MENIHENFITLEFENGNDIIESQFTDEYKKGNYFIYIELSDDHWSPNIYIPNSNILDPIMGSVIHLTSTASKKSNVYINMENSITLECVSKDETLIAMGNCNTGWMLSHHSN